jgi:hypothetical protein
VPWWFPGAAVLGCPHGRPTQADRLPLVSPRGGPLSALGGHEEGRRHHTWDARRSHKSSRSSEGPAKMMDAEACWREALCLQRELGRTENALGRAAFTMRYGQRGEWRAVLRDAAAVTLRETRRAASGYNRERLRRAVGCYLRLAECEYREVAELMLRAGSARAGAGRNRGRGASSCTLRPRSAGPGRRRQRGTAGEGGGEGAAAIEA